MVILIADDDQDDFDLFVDAINTVDPAITCIPVNDGRKIFTILENTLPDFLFLDVNMPLMSGKECVTQLKTSERHKDTPMIIIMYTTSINPTERNYYQDLGVKVLNKEVTIARTIQNLKGILQ